MKRVSKLTRALWVVASLLLLTVAACKKSQDVIARPVITEPVNHGLDSIAVGSSLTLRPTSSNTAGANFIWTVNGVSASTDSVFTFTPTLRGDYTIAFTVTNAGGASTLTYQTHVWGKYENGFFMVNEGQFGTGGGTLGFFRYDTHTLEDSVFTKENAGNNLEPATSSLEFGTVFNNKLYLMAKSGGPLVSLDALSLKETGRIASDPSNDFRALLGLDTTRALVSTGNGLFSLNLQTLTLGLAITSVTGETDDIVKIGNYIFVLSANDGLDVLNISDYSIAKTFAGLSVGFAQAMDGSLWAAGDSLLVRIDPSTLDTQQVTLPFEVNGTFGFWHPGSIAASTQENSIFIADNGPYSGATTVYKYQIGNSSSLSAPFISVAAGKELYGAGLAYNAAKNQLVVSTVQSGYGTNYSINDLDFYDPASGFLSTDNSYSGYYFPAMAVFH